jgi:hypothetical protein
MFCKNATEKALSLASSHTTEHKVPKISTYYTLASNQVHCAPQYVITRAGSGMSGALFLFYNISH